MRLHRSLSPHDVLVALAIFPLVGFFTAGEDPVACPKCSAGSMLCSEPSVPFFFKKIVVFACGDFAAYRVDLLLWRPAVFDDFVNSRSVLAVW